MRLRTTLEEGSKFIVAGEEESAIELKVIDFEVKVVPTYQYLAIDEIDEAILESLFSDSDSNSDQIN
jgi:hypothetical protein